PEVRDNTVAITLFGIGLIALAAAGIVAALRRAQNHTPRRTRIASAHLPLAAIAALFLPQSFLPPPGRIVYGSLFAVAAAYAAYVLITSTDEPGSPERPDHRRGGAAMPSPA